MNDHGSIPGEAHQRRVPPAARTPEGNTREMSAHESRHANIRGASLDALEAIGTWRSDVPGENHPGRGVQRHHNPIQLSRPNEALLVFGKVGEPVCPAMYTLSPSTARLWVSMPSAPEPPT